MDVISTILKSLIPRAHESIMCSDLSPQQFALARLNENLFKKLEPKGTNHTADKAALDLFIESNARCGTWKPDENSYHYDTMIRARDKFHARLQSGYLQESKLTLANAMGRLRPGPGSSIGTKHTDFVGKVFNSRLSTYDKQLWQYYSGHCTGSWKLAEAMRERQFGSCDVVQASKMTYAKKNATISRVINTEASLEMLFQLGMGTCIEDLLLEIFNINLSTQPTINRFLAKLGSIYGSHATIDLKSASDLISTEFVRWFFGPKLVKPLDTIRAKCIELPDGTLLELNTFSTMGNGFTFPLQTLLFACIVEAAYEELGLPTHQFGMTHSFSVFGDDIICVRSAYDKVIALLEWCGFTVNKDKSFNTGGFRESCGEDYFQGHNVRSVYVKKCSHETQVYSVFNRLTRWSIHNGVCLADALRYLKGLVKFRPVPFDAQDIAGLKLPLCLSGKTANCHGLVRYKELLIKTNSRDTRDYETNPEALFVGALGGFLVGDRRLTAGTGTRSYDVVYDSVFKPVPHGTAVGQFGLRNRPDGPPVTRASGNSSSSWDWIPHQGLTPLDYFIALSSVITIEDMK